MLPSKSPGQFRMFLFFPWTVSFALSVHCGGECIEAELLSRRPTDNGPPSPLDRNPLRRTLEYTLIHREVPKPIEEQRRALNKQIKGRLTVGSIQWSANGQRGLWQFSAPPFTPRPTRRRRGDSAFTWQENANNKVISFHLIWEGCWVKSPTAIYRNSWFPCFENYFHRRPHRTISVRCFLQIPQICAIIPVAHLYLIKHISGVSIMFF